MSHPHHAIGQDSDDSDNSELDESPRTIDVIREDYARNASTSELGTRTAEDNEANLSGSEEREKLLNDNNGQEDVKEERAEGTDAKGASRSRRGSRGNALILDASALRQRRRSSIRVAKEDPLFFGLQPRTALLLIIPALVLLVLAYKSLPSWSTEEPPAAQAAAKADSSNGLTPMWPDLSAAGETDSVGESWSDILGEKGAKLMDHTGMKSNGTHWFNNTVLIISLDGVRASYLEEGYTPHLLSLSKKGIRAAFLQSIFPTLTFPNHWAIQTGLYAESHGIMANDFWDPSDETEFVYTNSAKSWKPKWWLGEPMWETVNKAGLKSAVLMWPGPPKMQSGAHPTYFAPFQNDIHWNAKTAQIAKWLDMPDKQRPQLICAYLPEVDQQGHSTGPDSAEVEEKLRYVDDFARSISDVLSARHLTEIVNVIYVADHGMTRTANERLVYLDEVLEEDGFVGIAHKEGWPSCGLRFKDGIDESIMVERMKKAAADSKGGFAYYNHETMPKEWHFSGSPRIAPHWLVPEVGWAITDKQEFYYMNNSYAPLGNHGYNNSHPDMHAIFVGHGPFASRLRAQQREKRGTEATEVIPGFANLEIYNLVTQKLLKLPVTAPNNGTVGFWDQYLDD